MIASSKILFSAFWQIILTYRGMMLIQAIRLILLPTVLLSAWLSIEKAPGNPYSNSDYLLYYLMVPLILNLTDSRTIFKFPAAVRDGSLSRDLLKPYPPAMIFVIETITGNMVQLIYLLPITGICLVVLKEKLPAIELSTSHLGLFLLAIGTGFIIRMLVAGCIALLGFWIENVTTLNLVINGGVWALLGGMIVPVATFPETIRNIAGYLPYRYMLSFPIEVLSGRLAEGEILFGFTTIFCWSVLLLVISRFLWKRGLKGYTAYGG
jgi:ABC-2 type transport system permease protein